MGRHYRTEDNGDMRRMLAAFALLLASTSALSWNGAGHRLVAAVAWRQMSPVARQEASILLQRHPDYPKWMAKTGDDQAYAIFLAAATWPDDIRNDKRFFDEGQDEPTPPFPGMPDTARHKGWHYVDRHPDGRIREGELHHQLERLIGLLHNPSTPTAEQSYALPWVIHLLGDIHQPLHAGSRDDEGGNRFEIENPFRARHPFTNLHAWWDDLPGPPWLRGERLEKAVETLLATYPALPPQGGVSQWEQESREISREEAYPPASGSLLPIITPEFQAHARSLANRRLAEAGYRLGRLLESCFNRVSRGTRSH